jgi:hypothetical protein
MNFSYDIIPILVILTRKLQDEYKILIVC